VSFSAGEPQILSMQLTTGIVEWLKQNTYFDGFFKSFNDYPRLEFVPNETPALSVYPGICDTVSNSWNEQGTINIEAMFSLYENRQYFSKNVIIALQMLRGQLLTNPVYIRDYLDANYVPGLLSISTNNAFVDIGKLKEKSIQAKNGCLGFVISLKYKINILANQKALWRQGKDYYSPVNTVYNPVAENTIVYTGLPNN
jgi:hypothetical protein